MSSSSPSSPSSSPFPDPPIRGISFPHSPITTAALGTARRTHPSPSAPPRCCAPSATPGSARRAPGPSPAGLCRDKPAVTFDNFVSGFGLDGKGGEREEYAHMWRRATATEYLQGLLEEGEEETGE
ncbi:hypothetical protein F4802DRAFT_432735 [Xylaria palmicola]|nr:hypothetical protein F4802DRAFT_432735 [Xylaria palmicola]